MSPLVSTFCRTVVALIFLSAAALKLFGASDGLGYSDTFEYPQTLLLATIEWEIILGIWLLSGATPRISSSLAFVTFLAFAAVSAHRWMLGEVDCNCFGVVHATPWAALAVDAMGLIVVSVGHFSLKSRSLPPLPRKKRLTVPADMVASTECHRFRFQCGRRRKPSGPATNAIALCGEPAHPFRKRLWWKT